MDLAKNFGKLGNWYWVKHDADDFVIPENVFASLTKFTNQYFPSFFPFFSLKLKTFIPIQTIIFGFF